MTAGEVEWSEGLLEAAERAMAAMRDYFVLMAACAEAGGGDFTGYEDIMEWSYRRAEMAMREARTAFPAWYPESDVPDPPAGRRIVSMTRPAIATFVKFNPSTPGPGSPQIEIVVLYDDGSQDSDLMSDWVPIGWTWDEVTTDHYGAP